jgi:hypothetical protein
MPDEITFELASSNSALSRWPCSVSAMNGSNCAHDLVLETWKTPLRRPQRSRPASLQDGRTKRWPLRSGFAPARMAGQCITSVPIPKFVRVDIGFCANSGIERTLATS